MEAREQDAQGGLPRGRIRLVAFWVTTFIVVFELAAGSVWNLWTIDWIEAQLHHLKYPHFFTYILGVWQAGAAVAIIVPGLPLIKEWAYAGALFLWSGAVVSHLAVGDSPDLWGVPLMFATLALASWVLRPADRRFPETRWHRGHRSNVHRHEGDASAARPSGWEIRPRAWAAPLGLLVGLYAVSFLTLPTVDTIMGERAVNLGWIDE